MTTHADIDRGQALPAGTRLEEFVIERVLGSGGFGITYLARDVRLDRQVVIKENLPAPYCFRDLSSLNVMPRHTHGDDADNFRWSLENFTREASMLASLDHPSIVRMLGSFEAFGTAYFVMPLVEGQTLDQLAKARADDPFSEFEFLGFLEWLLDALSYLHERGIYHRDIKPANILVTREGKPILIDFGSARQLLSERSLTVVESAGYTPFEQLQSRGNVGPWSDLYALAATVVKIMTGEAPAKANDRTMGDLWQPLAGREDLQGCYSQNFLQCLDRTLRLPIEERWQSAAEWQTALAEEGKAQRPNANAIKLTRTTDAAGLPGKHSRKRSFAYSLTFVVFILFALLGGYLWNMLSRSQNSSMIHGLTNEVPLMGSLFISSDPVGATLKDLSGKSIGTTPAGITGLYDGEIWKGTLEFDGYESAAVEAVAEAGHVKEVPTVRLVALLQKVVVSSAPAGAKIFEGKKELGVTPLEIAKVAPDVLVRYSLRLEGFEHVEVSGRVDVGRSMKLHAELKSITISSMPVIDPYAEQLVKEGQKARVAGDMGLAIVKLTEAQNKSPNDPTVLYELGLIYEQMGVFDTAGVYYEKVYHLGISVAGSLYSLADGKLRERIQKPDAMAGKLALGRVQIFKDLKNESEQRVVLTIPVQKSLHGEIDVAEMRILVIFFNKTSKGEIIQLEDNSWVTEQWASLPFDWNGGEESLRMTYRIPNQDNQTEHLFGGRTYYGQVVSLLYKGEILDVQAWPRDLAAKIPSAPNSGRGGP